MSVGAAWHLVDEVDDAILEAADIEPVDDVQHQWASVRGVRVPAVAESRFGAGRAHKRQRR
jgi:hypothetical protein